MCIRELLHVFIINKTDFLMQLILVYVLTFLNSTLQRVINRFNQLRSKVNLTAGANYKVTQVNTKKKAARISDNLRNSVLYSRLFKNIMENRAFALLEQMLHVP